MDNLGWLNGMLHKRTPDACRILMDLLEAGIRKGEVSANDVRDVHFDNPKIIGGVFKILPKFGFVHTERRVKATAERKHGRRVDIWELENRFIAETCVSHLRHMLLNSVVEQLTLEM